MDTASSTRYCGAMAHVEFRYRPRNRDDVSQRTHVTDGSPWAVTPRAAGYRVCWLRARMSSLFSALACGVPQKGARFRETFGYGSSVGGGRVEKEACSCL